MVESVTHPFVMEWIHPHSDTLVKTTIHARNQTDAKNVGRMQLTATYGKQAKYISIVSCYQADKFT